MKGSIRSLKPAALLLGALACAVLFGPSAVAQTTADPATLFNAGQDAHERGQYRDAVELYKKALQLFPKFPEAEFQLGNAYRELGEFDLAEEAYRRALDIRRNWTLPMVSLASLRASRGDYREAENLVQDAISLGGQNAAAYAVLADVVLRRDAPPAELRLVLDPIRELNSRPRPQAFLLVSQARLERKLGEGAAASGSVARALKLEPNNGGAIAESVELALDSDDSAAAVANAERLLKLTPASDDAKLLAARAYAAAGETERALAQLDAIKERGPMYSELRNSLEIASSKDPAELERLLVARPNDALVIGRLCSLLRTSNPQRAVDYCRRLLESDPSNITFATRYAAALVQAQKYPEAAALLLKLKEASPDNHTVRANLATVYFQTKRWKEAKAEYIWLQERQPENPVTSYFLGIVCDRLEEYVAALSHYQRFLELADPKTLGLEIEKVNLRLPGLRKQIRENKGK